MKNLLLVLGVLVLVACGARGKSGADGLDSARFGITGESTGVDFEDIGPGLACAAGGVSIFTFKDENSDGIFQSEEVIIKVKALCHGTNGSSASTTLESITSSATCPNGGVKISSGLQSPVEVCNGANGLNGEQGIQGVQGVPGIAGAQGAQGAQGEAGTSVTPVKFCADDNSTYPEYGLLIGEDLYAVNWGTTPASPSTPQAFLTKLVAGNYMSTGGNNCLFSVH